MTRQMFAAAANAATRDATAGFGAGAKRDEGCACAGLDALPKSLG